MYTVQNANDAGPDSLRDGINDPTVTSITFNPLVTSITLTSGSLLVTNRLLPLSIDGGINKVTIDGNSANGVFVVNNSTAQLLNLIIENGDESGIRAVIGSVLAIADSIIQNNEGNEGGGIFVSSSTLNVSNSIIRNNSNPLLVGTNGGGVYLTGSSATILSGTISSNTSPFIGGGIFVDINASLTLQNSVVDNNTSASTGGGIFNQGTLIVRNSTIANNTSGSTGGGIQFNSSASGNSIINATIISYEIIWGHLHSKRHKFDKHHNSGLLTSPSRSMFEHRT